MWPPVAGTAGISTVAAQHAAAAKADDVRQVAVNNIHADHVEWHIGRRSK
jgi:hypothetical protein